MLNLKKVLVFVLVIVFFTLILAVSKDFFKVQIFKRAREFAPRPYYYDSIVKQKHSSNGKSSTSSQVAESTQVKRRKEHTGHNSDLRTQLQSPSKTKKILAPPDSSMKQGNVAEDVHNGHTLPQEVIDGVKTFVFFIGYQRSGSSIMSSLMDAHPHTVVSYQYGNVFTDNKKSLTDKNYLFNELYRKSQKDAASGDRSESIQAKNYSLHVPSQWQGKYDRHISLIGNKNAGKTVAIYVSSPSTFIRRYKMLQKSIGVPMKAVFVVRNPFDIISTAALYDNSNKLSEFVNIKPVNNVSEKLQRQTSVAEYKSAMKRLYESGNLKEFQDARFETDTLASFVKKAANSAKGIEGIIDLMGSENVWQVHNMDLVNEPKKTLIEMCDFFEIDCSPDYIETCAGTVFKSVSKTRELLVWPQKEKQRVMDSIVKRFSFFNRYSF